MTKVKGIMIEVGGEQVELSIEEARELFNELQQLFSPGTIYVYPNYPQIPWIQPNSDPWCKTWTDDGTNISDGVDFCPTKTYMTDGMLVM